MYVVALKAMLVELLSVLTECEVGLEAEVND